MFKTTLLALTVATSAWGAIADQGAHANNQKIIAQVIGKEVPTTFTSEQKASFIIKNLVPIASNALEKGFDPTAYDVSENANGDLEFVTIPVWEGKEIPATLFVYIWPSEGAALKHAPYSLKNTAYRSGIHTHPIPFSLTPLKGTIQQTRYKKGADGVPKMMKQQKLSKGDITVDDLSETFVHEMAVVGDSPTPTFTLNAFGAPTAEAVAASFKGNETKRTPSKTYGKENETKHTPSKTYGKENETKRTPSKTYGKGNETKQP